MTTGLGNPAGGAMGVVTGAVTGIAGCGGVMTACPPGIVVGLATRGPVTGVELGVGVSGGFGSSGFGGSDF